MKNTFVILAIFLISFFLRIVFINWIPWGFHWDEASYGYNAYSIMMTGKDEWGNNLPLFLKAYGDYKPAFLSYFMIPFFLVFGISEFSARLAVVILSSFGILAFFFLLNKTCKKDHCHQLLPITASFILIFSPWHLHYSRIAFDPILSLSFILIGVNLYIDKSSKKRFFGILSLLFSMYLYNSARIFVPVLIILTEYFLLFDSKKNTLFDHFKKQSKILLVGLIGIIIIWASTLFSHSGDRAKKVFFWNWSEANVAVEEGIYRSVVNNLPLIRVFHNKIIYVINDFTTSYFSHFSPEFLLLENNQSGEFAFSRFGYILIVFIPFIILGVIDGKRDRLWRFFLFWLLVAPLPSSLSSGAPNGNRALIMVPALTYFSARGMLLFTNFLSKIQFGMIRLLVITGMSFLILFNIILYLRSWYLFFPEDSERHFHGFYAQASKDIYELSKKYDKIYMSDGDTQTYIFFSWYNLVDPEIIQSQASVRKIDMRGVEQINNIFFTSIKENNASCIMKEENVAVISAESDGWVLPENKFSPLKEYYHLSRYHSDQKSILRLYESNNLSNDQREYLDQACQNSM